MKSNKTFQCRECWDSPCTMNAPSKDFLPKECPWAPKLDTHDCHWKELDTPPLWHTNEDTPEEGSEVYIHTTDHERLIVRFGCRYLGEYELTDIRTLDDLQVPVSAVKMWAYVDKLEERNVL